MKDSGFKLNKEKVFGTIISFAIILTLGYGIYSVAVNSGRKENQENIVNLNESGQDNVALRTEDVTQEYSDILQVPERQTAVMMRKLPMPVQRQKDFLPRRKISQPVRKHKEQTRQRNRRNHRKRRRQRLLPRQIRLRRTLLMKVIR